MRKAAFIIAMALVFLVGGTTVLKQKSLAMEKKGNKKIVLCIPISEGGEPVLDQIKGKRLPLPINMCKDNKCKWQTIDRIEEITVMKITKNPPCFVVCNRGN